MPRYCYYNVPQVDGRGPKFQTVERRHVMENGDTANPTHAVFTVARSASGGFYVLALSRVDRGWHIIGRISVDLGIEPLSCIALELSSTAIDTGAIECWA